LVWLVSADSASAEVLRVPLDYLTIRSALAVAQAGDTVLVSEGTHGWGSASQHVRAGVTVLAAGDRENTFWRITGGLHLDDGPGTLPTVIEGFHLQMASSEASGVISWYRHATIRNNLIGDISPGGGANQAAIFCNPCALIERNWVSTQALITIAIESGVVTVRNNLLAKCPYDPAWAIDIAGASADSVFLVGNTFGYGHGRILVSNQPWGNPHVEAVNNLFDGGGLSGCIQCRGTASTANIHVRYNLFAPSQDGCSGVMDCPSGVEIGPGNIFGEFSQFCLTDCLDHRLQPTSPAVGAGEVRREHGRLRGGV